MKTRRSGKRDAEEPLIPSSPSVIPEDEDPEDPLKRSGKRFSNYENDARVTEKLPKLDVYEDLEIQTSEKSTEEKESDVPVDISGSENCPEKAMDNVNCQEEDPIDSQIDRGDQRAPLYIRKRQIPFNSQVYPNNEAIMLHLYTDLSCESNVSDHEVILANHPDVKTVTATNVFIRRLDPSWKTREVLHESEVTPTGGTPKKLLLLSVAKDPEKRRPIHLSNFNDYLRSLIGQCAQCQICVDQTVFKALGTPFKLSKRLLDMELEEAIAFEASLLFE